jgi:hypothetical protein
MDELHVALWREIGKVLPSNAEAVQPEGHGNLIVSWRLPEEGRLNRQSREISIRFTSPVMGVLSDADEARLPDLARKVARAVRRALAVGKYEEARDDLPSFVVFVDDEVLD